MSKTSCDCLKALLVPHCGRHPSELRDGADRRPANAEMARVLKTAPLRMASDPSNGAIACWKHDAPRRCLALRAKPPSVPRSGS
jgi:hypothetical protein